MTDKILRVILADDHELLRAGFAATLSDYGIEVVASTGDVDEVRGLYEQLKPSVVVLDILFQGRQTGLDAIKQLKSSDRNAHIVVLSQFDQDSLIKESYNAGALAFIPKVSDTSILANAIRLAANGQIYIMPEISARLALMAARPAERSPIELLSKRELEVFTLLAKGCSADEISAELDISIRTVANLTQVIKKKLGITRNTEMTILAVRHKIIEV